MKKISEATPLTLGDMDGRQALAAYDPDQVGADVSVTQGILNTTQNGEYSTTGELVYPYWYAGNESITYTAGQITQRQTNDGAGTTWTMGIVQGTYGPDSMTCGNGASNWSRTITRDVAGTVTNDTGWVKL